MKCARPQLAWAGIGFLAFAAAVLFCIRFDLLSISGEQLQTRLPALIAAGCGFLGVWIGAARMRRVIPRSATVFYLCVLALAVVIVVGAVQLVNSIHNELLLGSELILCIALGVVGAFAGVFLYPLVNKQLDKQGLL